MTYIKGQQGYWLGKKKPIPLEVREKISKTLLGHTVSEGTREKISSKNKGKVAWNKGRTWPKETREKISLTNKSKGIEPEVKFVGFGEDHPRWKGGYENDLANNRRRRAIKRGAEGSHTLQDWEKLKELNNFTCVICERFEPEVKLTEDHIVPLSKGGVDSIDNIQPLCRSCNARKGNRI